MARMNPKLKARRRRKGHIRKMLSGTAERPRLSVFRSARHIYAQLIDDVAGCTLVSASSLGREDVAGGNREGAKLVGADLAKKALDAKVDTVVFDRNGFRYHGRVAALADAAREGGLKF